MGTREKIIEMSVRLFNEKGLVKVGVRDVSRNLNISPGNMSYYFPKKEDLVSELLEDYTAVNEEAFNEYFAYEGTLFGFMQLMEKVLHNQYRFRGIFVGFEENLGKANAELMSISDSVRWHNRFDRILMELSQNGQLRAQQEDIDFLVSSINFIRRYWMIEAFVDRKDDPAEEVVAHYLALISKQLSLYGTFMGKRSLDEFGAY